MGFTLVLTADAREPQAGRGWVLEWLNEYVGGAHGPVALRLTTVADLSTLEKDLDAIAAKWIADAGASAPERRRALAAFALEAAYARLAVGAEAIKLLEWGCRQVRRTPRGQTGDFERLWHLAAFAVMAGGVDPDAMDAHVNHVKLQFPAEPRLAYQRAVAAELRTAPFYRGGRATADEVQKRLEDAARRYREAASEPSTKAEVHVRWARVELARDRPLDALAVLDGMGAEVEERAVAYLASLFRGQALERLNRPDEASAEYERALTLVPNAQSAMTSLAALHVRRGRPAEAEVAVNQMLARTTLPLDPWWVYWPADYRHITTLLPAVRGAIK